MCVRAALATGCVLPALATAWPGTHRMLTADAALIMIGTLVSSRPIALLTVLLADAGGYASSSTAVRVPIEDPGMTRQRTGQIRQGAGYA